MKLKLINKYQSGKPITLIPNFGLFLIPQYLGLNYEDVNNSFKENNPRLYNNLLLDIARSKSPNSEIVGYVDADGNRKLTSQTVGLSGRDPLITPIVEGVALSPVFNVAGKAALWGLGKAGNKWTRAALINKSMKSSKAPVTSNRSYDLNLDESSLEYLLRMAGRKKIPYKKQYNIKEINPEIKKNLKKTDFDLVKGPDNILGSVIGTYNDPRNLAYYNNIIAPLLKSKNVKEVPTLKDVEVFKSVVKEPKWGGFHSKSTGRNFIVSNSNDPRGAAIHEAGSHGTDHLINIKDYNDLYYNTVDYNPMTESLEAPKQIWDDIITNMKVPGIELRATFNLARMLLYDKASKKFNKNLTSDEFNKYLDTLNDSEILKSMYLDEQGNWINGYAAGMGGHSIKMNNWLTDRTKDLPKKLILKYRNSYKTLPIVGIPALKTFKNLK